MVAPALPARRQKASEASARPAPNRPLLEAAPAKQPEPLLFSQQQRRNYPATFGQPFEFGVPLTFDRRPVLFTGALQMTYELAWAGLLRHTGSPEAVIGPQEALEPEDGKRGAAKAASPDVQRARPSSTPLLARDGG